MVIEENHGNGGHFHQGQGEKIKTRERQTTKTDTVMEPEKEKKSLKTDLIRRILSLVLKTIEKDPCLWKILSHIVNLYIGLPNSQLVSVNSGCTEEFQF